MIEIHFARLRDGKSEEPGTLDLNSFDEKEVAFVKCHFEVCCKDLCEKHIGIWIYDECNVDTKMVRRYMDK